MSEYFAFNISLLLHLFLFFSYSASDVQAKYELWVFAAAESLIQVWNVYGFSILIHYCTEKSMKREFWDNNKNL